jgi:hypothetical protein
VIVIDGIYATETQKLRISKKYFVSIGDAEDAHLQKLFCLYAEMQKMRIFKDSILSVSLPHRVDGGRETPYFL